MLPPVLSDRRFSGPQLIEPGRHCIELIRKTRYGRRPAIRIFTCQNPPADAPINDVHDAPITADHALVNDVHATIA
jgi:hypothetical protein